MKIPYCDLNVQHAALARELDLAVARVVRNSSFILGTEVAEFERAFAAYIGVRYAVGTSNGTTALMVALKSLHVGPGDEVIVPAMTFFATAEAVAFLGATPVFVDIDPATFTIDTSLLQERITEKTSVILPVHLYGHPADLDRIRTIADEHGIRILGDCAHAHGAEYKGRKVGAIEDCAAFSFYPSKNLGCWGEAGMITTNDEETAALCRRYRDHGSDRKFVHDAIGTNARMEGLQAAILSVKLPHLDTWNTQRRDLAAAFNSRLHGLPLSVPSEAEGVRHVYHIYQIRLAGRDAALAHLSRRGVSATLHYPCAMHLHEGFSYLHYRPGDFPVAERLARETLSLPCFPGMTGEQLSYVSGCLSELYPGVAAPRGDAWKTLRPPAPADAGGPV